MNTSKLISLAKNNAPSVYAGFIARRVPKLTARLEQLRFLYKSATKEQQINYTLEADDIKRELKIYTSKED